MTMRQPQRLAVPGPKARALLARDAEVVSPSYPRDYPFVMSHGRGVEVWDVDGNRFLDFAAGIAVCATGHSHPQVVAALQQQAARFLHISSDFWHEGWVQLAETLDRIAPFRDDAQSFLCNSGAESVEAAIKLARYHTRRPRLIGFHGGFHGRTMGALSFTSSKTRYREGFFPTMPGVTLVPYPDPRQPRLATRGAERLGAATVRYIEEVIFAGECPPAEVAAVLVEPIQGEGGYVIPPADFFPALRELCDRYGILLIVDEVQSGIGRTGRYWAIEHEQTEPDIVCSAKGIASGVPLGAMIARRRLMTWPRGAHGNTYGGNPLACAAANATLALLDSELLANAQACGARLLAGLTALRQTRSVIGDLRGRGLMVAVDFVQRDGVTPDGELRTAIEHLAFEHGLLLLGCGAGSLRITPPLTVSPQECDEALAILGHAIDLASGRERR